MRIQVKICGITNVDDAEAVVKFGADAIGLIFYEKSPRFLSSKKAKEIIAHLPPFIVRVGVFVNPSREQVHHKINSLNLDRVQFHGEESPAFCEEFGSRVIKAIQVKNANSLNVLNKYPLKTFLLDTYNKNLFGGTGQTFDWSLAVKAKDYGQLILSGGLSPENISQAIRIVAPYGVDISSGVEEAPGKKDHLKIKRLMEIIRREENSACQNL